MPFGFASREVLGAASLLVAGMRGGGHREQDSWCRERVMPVWFSYDVGTA